MKKYFKKQLFFIPILTLLISLNGCSLNRSPLNKQDNNTSQILQYIGDGVCIDIRTGLMWQMDKSRKYSSPQQAEQHIKELQLADHNGWRLPTKEELFALHDTLFRHLNGNCSIKLTGNYWATAEDGDVVSGHWETDYLCGPEFNYVESYDNTGYVRAVRLKK